MQVCRPPQLVLEVLQFGTVVVPRWRMNTILLALTQLERVFWQNAHILSRLGNSEISRPFFHFSAPIRALSVPIGNQTSQPYQNLLYLPTSRTTKTGGKDRRENRA